MTAEFVRKYQIYKILLAPKSSDGYVSAKTIKEALEREYDLHKDEELYKAFLKASPKNITRDIKSIEAFFGVEIIHKRGKGYFIQDDTVQQELQKLIFDKVELFLLKDKEKQWRSHITPEQSSLNTSINIIGLLRAIESKLYVYIVYKGWYDDANFKTTQTKIQPLHLKQTNKGWYLIGYDEQNGIYAYCLDTRMQSLKISTKPVKDPIDFDAFAYFKNLLGILDNKMEPERVVLQVANHHFKYLQTKPLPNQKILTYPKVLSSESLHVKDYLNPDIWGTIATTLQLNYEFIMELYRYNIWVKVIEPKWFASKIAKQYQFLTQEYYSEHTLKK